MGSKTAEQAQALAIMNGCPQVSDREIARRLGVSNKSVSRWRADAQLPAAVSTPPGGLARPDLLARLAQYGISEHQLARWRADRLLPSPVRIHRAGGSTAIYAESSVAQAVEVKTLLRRYRKRSRDFAALGLFALGWEIEIDRVREAHVGWISDNIAVYQLLAQILGETGQEWDEAFNWLAAALGSSRYFDWVRARARFRGRGQAPEDRMTPAQLRISHLEAIVGMVLRGALDQADTAETLSAMESFRVELGLGEADLAASFRPLEGLLPYCSAPALIDVAQTAAAEDLRACMNQAAAIVVILAGLYELGEAAVAQRDEADVEGPSLSSYLPDDPALLARGALVLTAVRRWPDFPEEVNEILIDLPAGAADIVHLLTTRFGGERSRAAYLATRYLSKPLKLGTHSTLRTTTR